VGLLLLLCLPLACIQDEAAEGRDNRLRPAGSAEEAADIV
jgi:hypothetical protein